MNTNMTGFRCFSKLFVSSMLWTKVASALEVLITNSYINPYYEADNDIVAASFHLHLPVEPRSILVTRKKTRLKLVTLFEITNWEDPVCEPRQNAYQNPDLYSTRQLEAGKWHSLSAISGPENLR